jgi:two-component system, response regulator PdtaR
MNNQTDLLIIFLTGLAGFFACAIYTINTYRQTLSAKRRLLEEIEQEEKDTFALLEKLNREELLLTLPGQELLATISNISRSSVLSQDPPFRQTEYSSTLSLERRAKAMLDNKDISYEAYEDVPIKPQKPLQLIIADRDVEFRKQIREVMNQFGYIIVAEASTEAELLQKAREHRPDLVIADAQLTAQSGFQTAKILFEEGIAPTLLLSVEINRSLVSSALQAKAGNLIMKTAKPEILSPSIELTVERYRKLHEMDNDINSLKLLLDNARLLQRAKIVLMDTERITEEEAFRKIQRLSQDKKQPVWEIALALLTGTNGIRHSSTKPR